MSNSEAEKQEQQPKIRTGDCLLVGVCASEGHKIAPQRQPLTDEQIMQKARESGLDLEPTRNMLIEVRGQHAQLVNMARSIEAKLKEKNA